MRKLNNKGITTVEVLICFVLVVIITVSIYTTVSTFNEKKVLEGYREKIINYKNLVTQEVQNDFIKIGLSYARYERKTEGEKVIHNVYCTLRDGSERLFVVEQLEAISTYHPGGSLDTDDYYVIKYGTPPDDLIDWTLPDVGHSGYNGYEKERCDVDAPARHIHCRKIQDLSINNVMINITDDNVLSIYVGFYHPEFGSRYAINIITPIDYSSSGFDSSTAWSY